jgi:hypothetical protein
MRRNQSLLQHAILATANPPPRGASPGRFFFSIDAIEIASRLQGCGEIWCESKIAEVDIRPSEGLYDCSIGLLCMEGSWQWESAAGQCDGITSPKGTARQAQPREPVPWAESLTALRPIDLGGTPPASHGDREVDFAFEYNTA